MGREMGLARLLGDMYRRRYWTSIAVTYYLHNILLTMGKITPKKAVKVPNRKATNNRYKNLANALNAVKNGKKK